MQIRGCFSIKKEIILHLLWSVFHIHRGTYRHTQAHQTTETKTGYLSVLPRGESQWGSAFSSRDCKCHAVPLLHPGKSTVVEKLRCNHSSYYRRDVKLVYVIKIIK